MSCDNIYNSFKAVYRCKICGEPTIRLREDDFTRFNCKNCSTPFYVYDPVKLPKPVNATQEAEKPSLFSLFLPFTIICILEIIYQFIL